MKGAYMALPKNTSAFTKCEVRYLVFLTVLGAIIRIFVHYDRPFANDEVGTLFYMGKSNAYLLTHFESWLTMNYFIILEKFLFFVAGGGRLSLMLVPMSAGVAAIPLTAVLAKVMASKRVALLASLLMCLNPVSIYFSGVIRAYALLAALSLVTLILYFKWIKERNLRNGILTAASCFVLLLAHLNGAYTVLSILAISFIDWFVSFKNRERKNYSTLLWPMLGALLFAILAYARLYSDIVAWSVTWTGKAPASINYIPYVFTTYFGKGYLTVPSLCLFVAALFLCFKRNSPLVHLFPFLLLPLLGMSLLGLSHYPWAYARFLFFLIPVCLIFISQGIDYLASCFPERTYAACFAGAGILIMSWAPEMIEGLDTIRKHPYHEAAGFIKAVTEKNDVVLFNEWKLKHNLEPYFTEFPVARSTVEGRLASDSGDWEGKMIFVVSRPLMNTNYPNKKFGDIQIVIYPRSGTDRQLLALRKDLLKTVLPGEVSAELAPFYRNIWALNNRLEPHGADNFDYYKMWAWCDQLTEKMLHAPENVLSFQFKKKARRLMGQKRSSPGS